VSKLGRWLLHHSLLHREVVAEPFQTTDQVAGQMVLVESVEIEISQVMVGDVPG